VLNEMEQEKGAKKKPAAPARRAAVISLNYIKY
jgi:hypothetical protein